MVNNSYNHDYYSYPPIYHDYPAYEPQKSVNYGIVFGSLAVIGICGLGVYYLYSQNELTKEYIYWAKEYQKEYEEAMDTYGEIPSDVQEQLEYKQARMEEIWKLVTEEGLLDKLIRLISWTFGGLIAIKVIDIIKHIIKEYRRKPPKYCTHFYHNPGNNPPGQPYYDPYHDITYTTPEEMMDDIKRNHPNQNDPVKNRDAWDVVLTLPSWILDWLGDTVVDFNTALLIGWASLEPWQQALIIAAVLAALIVLVALSCGALAPSLGPAIAACAAACI